MNDNPRSGDIVDTTDCFEAISAFKSAKNFLFFLILLSLLVTQAAFWLQETGYVEPDGGAEDEVRAVSMVMADADPDPLPEPAEDEGASEEFFKSTPQELAAKAEQAGEKVLGEQAEGSSDETAEQMPVEDDGEETGVEQGERVTRPVELPEMGKVKQGHLVIAVKIANFFLLFGAMLYCLVLLMSVKISLAGRMGGMSHISRAFLYSLFLLVVVIPWQVFLPGIVAGAVYLPSELFDGWQIGAESGKVMKILYYLRFVGAWVLALILLLNAQIRSARWSKTTLRRLGIVQ